MNVQILNFRQLAGQLLADRLLYIQLAIIIYMYACKADMMHGYSQPYFLHSAIIYSLRGCEDCDSPVALRVYLFTGPQWNSLKGMAKYDQLYSYSFLLHMYSIPFMASCTINLIKTKTRCVITIDLEFNILSKWFVGIICMCSP